MRLLDVGIRGLWGCPAAGRSQVDAEFYRRGERGWAAAIPDDVAGLGLGARAVDTRHAIPGPVSLRHGERLESAHRPLAQLRSGYCEVTEPASELLRVAWRIAVGKQDSVTKYCSPSVQRQANSRGER